MKRIRIVSVIAVVGLLAFACGKLKNEPVILNKAFDKYISAYTSDVVSINGAIQIVFNQEFAASVDRGSLSGLFSFSPSIKGSAEWSDNFTISFKPTQSLTPGTQYTGRFNLGKLVPVDKELSSFPLSFRTIDRNFSVEIAPLEANSPNGESYSLEGSLVASDYIENEKVEKVVEVKVDGKQVLPQWIHQPNNVHLFSVAEILRDNADKQVVVNWNGAAVDVKTKGSESLTVTSKDKFCATGVKVNSGKNVVLYFSDIIDASMDLDGLVQMTNTQGITVTPSANMLTVIPDGDIIGEATITVHDALKNINGVRLGTELQIPVTFSPEKPGLKAVGKGVVMPSSGNQIFQFLAANLSKVDITIIKIYENNLPWFLQEYSLGEASAYSSVRQFGRPVYKGQFDLITNQQVDHDKYNMFSVNLSDYITVEPGVLYRIELSMRPSYSLYPCNDNAPEELSTYEKMLDLIDDSEEWEGSDYYYENSADNLFYRYAYNWKESDNPCHVAYYEPDKKLVANVLVSDIGMMAKYGTDNSLMIFVTDLLTAKSVEGASVDVYDYQNQLIANAKTDKWGVARVKCDRRPILAVAESGSSKNYLSLRDGLSMSMSSFDITGEMPKDGIRAFLFAERDVRRPGDTIYIGLITRDPQNKLPEGYPVNFELYNPLGQRVDEQIVNLNGEGFVTFTSLTATDAATGNYRAQVRLGGAVFTKTIKIETVKPNRLKIDLTFPSAIAGGKSKQISGEIKARWLNGTNASDLRTTVDLLMKPVTTTFEGLSQFIFDDPVNDYYFTSEQIVDSKITGEGKLNFTYSPGEEMNAPGMLSAQFTTKVFEMGGDASIVTTTLPYAPYEVFAGINLPALGSTGRILYTDKDNEIKIVTVDKAGKKVNSKADVTIYKLDYKWWWESENEYLASYVSGYQKNIIFDEVVTTVNGEAAVNFNIEKEKWGRYLIRITLPSGHSTGKIVLVDWPYEYGMKQGGNDAATLLQLNTDKDKYIVGDDINISFPSPYNALAILTLENNSGVLDVVEMQTVAGNTSVKIKATLAMAPNVYVYVTLLQQHSQTDNDSPIRLYGVIPIFVENANSHLVPVISMPDKIRSQQKVDIQVTEQHKKKMTYTLAVVDEGLLDLTNYKTPDPWNWYYARQSLGVKTWDMYDMVLGAYGGTLGRIFAVGGDGSLIDMAKNMSQRFEPVVKFLGPFTIAAGKTGKHSITLPQYTGSVRVMVVAAGENDMFGSTEKRVTVSDPLMVLATAPRVLSPGDEVDVPVTVFANDGLTGSVTVSATGNEMVSFVESKSSVSFSEQGEKDVTLKFVTAKTTGQAHIVVTAASGAQTATYELNIEVRSPNPPEHRSETVMVNPGESFEKNFSPFGMVGTAKGAVEMFALPSMNLASRLSWLTVYPHGCTEQVTSAAFPQVYLSSLLGNTYTNTFEAKTNVQEALRIINTRQLSNGALTLWPGEAYPDDWVTSYAGHFAIEAQNAGFALPGGFMTKWVSYQTSQASKWKYQPQYRYTINDQAYRLFTLALAGSADRGAMNRLREVENLPALSRWLLAAAYATIGRFEAAIELVDVRNLGVDEELSSYYYGSDIRDKAIILYALTKLGNTVESVELLKELSTEFSTDEWMSTQTTAWGLFAYSSLARSLNAGTDKSIKAMYSLNGKEEIVDAKGAGATRQFTPVANNNVIVKNNGADPLFVTFTEEGIQEGVDETSISNNISMDISYMDMSMKPINPLSLKQGTEFLMAVKVENVTYRRLDDMALTFMGPSGWEIKNTRLFESNLQVKESSYDYRDYRDDKVLTYFSLERGEKKQYYIQLTASYGGTYILPSVVCEAMYDNSTMAREHGNTVVVTR